MTKKVGCVACDWIQVLICVLQEIHFKIGMWVFFLVFSRFKIPCSTERLLVVVTYLIGGFCWGWVDQNDCIYLSIFQTFP